MNIEIVKEYWKKLRKFLKNKYFRYALVSLLYLLWVIWVGNYWLLLGLPVIFDIYIYKKVNWTFWKKPGKPKSKIVEWVDALVFAVIAATFIRMFFIEAFTIPTSSMESSLMIGDYLFVSKYHYGPKVPNTPLSFPFVHHTLPLTAHTPSYLEWIQWDYERMAGLEEITHDDAVVFNFPEGDTVLVDMQDKSYYGVLLETSMTLAKKSGKPVRACTNQARQYVLSSHDITVRPVDKRENYIKRCVALPGDSLEVIATEVYINGKKQKEIEGLQFRYLVQTNTFISEEFMLENGIREAYPSQSKNSAYDMFLTNEIAEKAKSLPGFVSVTRSILTKGSWNQRTFPHSETYPWNEDYYGPIWIPKAGETIKLNLENIVLFERVIDVYEDNELEIKGGKILINGEETDEYTFKMDYFFMMGDNRHNSLDSRFWGFVPEDHIVGKALFIWFSWDSRTSSIRWDRIFKMVGH